MSELTSLAALEVALDEGLVPHLARLRAAGETELERALAIDLALLREHPEALIGCLLSRLPDSKHVGQWLRDLRVLHPGRPWLRALRPAPNSLQGPLRAELRRFAEPVLEGITDDGKVLIAAEGEHWRWDPKTAEVSPYALVNPKLPRNAVEWERGGDVRLVDQQSGKDVLLLVAPEDLSLWRLSADERWVALITKDEDWVETLTVFTAHGKEVFRAEASRVAFSENGEWMIRAQRSAVVSRPDGREAVQLADGGGFMSVANDGKWAATTRPGVVQWWTVDKAIAPDRAAPRALPIAFSLDGTRLTVGQELRDAVTGALIARLDFHQGEYLEGGPPSNWFHLGSRAIVVSDGFGGMRAWDARSGARIFHDPNAVYAQWTQLGFSPEGQHYAVTTHAGNEATLFSIEGSAARRVPLSLTETSALAVGPGGALIAQGSASGRIAIHLTDGAQIGSFSAHQAEIVRLDFLDAARMFSVDARGEAIVWRLADGAVLARRSDQLRAGLWDVSTWEKPRGSRWTLVRDRSLTRFVRADVQLIYPSSQDFVRHPTEPIFVSAEAMVRIEDD